MPKAAAAEGLLPPDTSRLSPLCSQFLLFRELLFITFPTLVTVFVRFWPQIRPGGDKQASGKAVASLAGVRRFCQEKTPTIVEFYAGEAGVSKEFYKLGWKVIINEINPDKIKWDAAIGFDEDNHEVQFLETPFIDIRYTTLDTIDNLAFAWFGFDCRTYCKLACALCL